MTSDLIREAWSILTSARVDDALCDGTKWAFSSKDARLLRRLVARAEAWEDVDNADDMTMSDVSRAIHGGRALVEAADREDGA